MVFSRFFLYWLGLLVFLLLVLMTAGALTRITDSGLSMVEWRPLLGIFPPFSEEGWQRVFELYKKTDEYRIINAGMSLVAFKYIFWWEYAHRLLGRLLGVVLVVPLVVFFMKGLLPKGFWRHGFALFLLGAGQGLLGWWMVKSGFVDRVDVSQYRLAAHFGLAVFIYGYLCGLLFFYLFPARRTVLWREAFRDARVIGNFFLVVLGFITLIAGAFVSGQDAGLVYNEWPGMAGQLIPPDYYSGAGFFENGFNNPVAAQLHHRFLAYALFLASGTALWIYRAGVLYRPALLFFALVLFQAFLGISLLFSFVHPLLAILHHISALLVFTAGLWLFHRAISVSSE